MRTGDGNRRADEKQPTSKFSGLMAAVKDRAVDNVAADVIGEGTVDQPSTSPIPASIVKKPGRAITPRSESTLQESISARRGRPGGKRSDPTFTQVTAYIGKVTHKKVKMALLEEGEGREFSELVDELLLTWLDKQF
jgi:hypothetical protein